MDFTPSATQRFQFQATLDGNIYTCAVSWNLVRQGYYLSIYTLGQALVGSIAMVGSPLGYDISLAKPFGFVSTLVFRAPTNQFEVSP